MIDEPLLCSAGDHVEWLRQQVHDRQLPASNRVRAAMSCLGICQEHHHALVVLVERRLYASAFALLRVAFEAYVRGMWLMLCAKEREVGGFLRGSEPPRMDALLGALEETPGFSQQVLSALKRNPTPHTEINPTDSPEYLEEQREYLEAEASWQPPTEPAPRTWPNLRIRLLLNGQPVVRSGYAISQDHYLCSFDWNQWRPDQLRMYARSFSGAYSRPDDHHTDWFRTSLKLGETAVLEVDA